ncbi:MAG: hypothetical protein IJI51_08690 [Lachnospiraceae bacterium]|nr:hypothetical protein [Lachnospiraceae bacterium]
MKRIDPQNSLKELPCSVCAVASALDGVLPEDTDFYISKLKDNGYASLTLANAYICNHLKVKRRDSFKRGLRPKLKNLHFGGRAIVCVYGHYIYLDHEDYWSFYNNEDDEVVAVWELK